MQKIDYKSAVASINKMGSVKSINMDGVTQEIWEWANIRTNWLPSIHIPGILMSKRIESLESVQKGVSGKLIQIISNR